MRLPLRSDLEVRPSGQTSKSDLEAWFFVNLTACATSALFQNPHDRDDRAPTPRRRWHTVQFVDLAQVADRLHVTTVHPEHEWSIRGHHPHQPLAVGRKYDWKRRSDAAGFRQDAHESNNIRG